MKHFFRLIILSFFITLNSVNAQVVTLLNEDFNSGFPMTWTRINNDGLTPQALVSFVDNAWVSYEDIDSTGSGDSCMVATSYYSPAGTANDWLITPAITLKSNGNILHWQARSQDPSYPDGYDVLISNTLPVMDSFYVNPVLFAVDFEAPYWFDQSVSLDSFADQTVYLAFRAKSTDQFLLLIDNVVVDADTLLSVNENENAYNFLNVFPNPANDFINVRAAKQIEQIMLMDVSGKVILSSNPFTDQLQVSLTGIKPGIYILYVRGTDGSQSQVKVIRS
jgi:Secretion system C-terminal sorting domain/Cleaved Adhesin Domain